MSILEPYYDSIYAHFSKWIKVDDKNSKWTIEDFPYSEGVNENLTYPHCWKCVTVNRCWFKNEQNKKPEHFDYSKYSYGEIPKSDRGIYHPHCHCKELAINIPKESDIKLILTNRKINNFYNEKSKWFYAWGFKRNDKDNFIRQLKEKTKKSFIKGNYEVEKHTSNGFQINIFVEINSPNNGIYKIKTCYIVFPMGKLRCVTLVGGRNNENIWQSQSYKRKKHYTDNNINLGEIGTICLAEIRDNSFYVQFDTNDEENWYKYCEIKIEDLELIEDSNTTDDEILEELPKNDPRWWCKVEDGYIMNLLGEKKNKIQYDYNS